MIDNVHRDWKIIIREIACKVANKKLNTEWDYTSMFYKEVLKAITKKSLPDIVEYRLPSIAGEPPHIVACKKHPYYYKDVFGNRINTECVTVYSGLIPKEEVDKIIEKAKRQYFDFIAITPEECDIIEKEIEKYIFTDVRDMRDAPKIFAILPLGMKSDTPCPIWNDVAQTIKISEIVEKINKQYAHVVKELENNKKYLNKLLKYIGGVRCNVFKNVPEKVLKENLPFVTISVVFENGCTLDFEDDYFLSLLDKVKLYESYIDDFIKDKMELYELMHSKEYPLVKLCDIHGHVVLQMLYDTERNILYVPEDLMGYIIGRKGERIKKISQYIGRKVRAIPIAPVGFTKNYLNKLYLKVVGESAKLRYTKPSAWEFIKKLYEIRKKVNLVTKEWLYIVKEIE